MHKEGFENKIFFSKYKPEKKIGEGSFGKIYSAININTNENFALKLELRDGGQNLLESEAYVLCYLKGGNTFKIVGIPSVKSYGFSGDNNILVMELLGKSLEDLFQECGGKFTLKTVCMIADQMIERIEYVHTKHIIHRDIKPDNFVMGSSQNENLVYLIDFGLAKKYRSSKNLQHIQFKNNKKLTGTARYASINALRGVEQSRRDDLEAIGYVLMYFLRGSLPWQGLKVDKKEDRYKKIYEKKKSTSPEDLCQGFPAEFSQYITYCRNLAFEQEPDYNYLRSLFKKAMETYGYQNDMEFDWLKNKKKAIGTSQPFNKIKPSQKNLEADENAKGKVINEESDNLQAYDQSSYNEKIDGNKNTKMVVNQSNYKFFDNIKQNEKNLNKGNYPVMDTVQFNREKDLLEENKDNKFQTNLNYSQLPQLRSEKRVNTNNNKASAPKEEVNESASKKKDGCVVF